MRPQLQWIWKQTNSFNRQFGASLLTARCSLLLTGSILSWIMTGEWGGGVRESFKWGNKKRACASQKMRPKYKAPHALSLRFHIFTLSYHLPVVFLLFSKEGRSYLIDIYKLRLIVSHFKGVKTHLMSNSLDMRELKQRQRGRQRKRQKKEWARLAKQQLCTCITLFYTFLCRRCTYTTWNFLISRSVEDVNSRQRISISSSEFAFGALELNSRKTHQNLTNWTWWNKRV